MKIVTFKIPCRVYRENGATFIQIFEDQRTQVSDNSIALEASNIPSKAKEIADQNDSNINIAKSILMSRETEAKSFVNLSYLME